MNYESTLTYHSEAMPGVIFTIRRISFGRRLELLKTLRGLALNLERHGSGEREIDKIDTAITEAEMQARYIAWGLVNLSGLKIDGAEVNAATLIESGPEPLCKEVAEHIRAECFLTSEERKN